MSQVVGGTGAQAAPSKDERTWGTLCHLSALAGFVVPFGNVLGPLVVWIMKKAEYALVDREGKKVLNFQITVSIVGIILLPLCFILIGIPLVLLLGLASLVLTIIAAVRTSNGEEYNYPVSIKFIK